MQQNSPSSSTSQNLSINSLPTETLLRIFKICQVWEKEDRKEAYSPNRNVASLYQHSAINGFGGAFGGADVEDYQVPEERLLPFEVGASHVCRHWRNALLSDPSFWTSITFDEPAPFPKSQAYLSRSQTSPLEIEFCLTPSRRAVARDVIDHSGVRRNLLQALDLVFPFVYRWRSFMAISSYHIYMHDILNRLSTASSAPLLEVLSLMVTDASDTSNYHTFSKGVTIFSGNTPRLAELGLRNVRLDWEGSRAMFKNLRNLVLEGGEEDDDHLPFSVFRGMLEDSGVMENLVLNCAGIEKPRGLEAQLLVELPTLRFLSLCGRNTVFLDHVNVPCLHELEYHTWPLRFDVNAINEHGRSLTRRINDNGDTILSSVQIFDFQSCYSEVDQMILLEIIKQLTQLKFITLGLHSSNVEYDASQTFISLMTPKSNGKSTVLCPQLKTMGLNPFVGLFFTDEELIYFMNGVLAPFRKLMASRRATGYPIETLCLKNKMVEFLERDKFWDDTKKVLYDGRYWTHGFIGNLTWSSFL